MEAMDRIKYWWMPVILGIILIAGSFYVATQPIETFISLALLFGWLITFNGLSSVIFAIRNKNTFDGWQWNLMFGIFELILGIILIFKPHLSAETLILFTGFWLMFSAISRVSFSWVLKNMDIKDWWIGLASGIIMLVFSVLIIINPIFAMISIVYLVSIPMTIFGLLSILFGFQIRKLNSNS